MKRSKARLRKKMAAKLEALKAQEIGERSREIKKKVLAHEAFRRARHLLIFASMPKEVSTWPIVNAAVTSGKKVYLPVCRTNPRRLEFYRVERRADTRLGAYGIREPKQVSSKKLDIRKADCVFVPGVAFDESGRRLGRGAGYYDQFLSRLPKKAVKIGLGFSFQLVAKVPIEPHDVSLDQVITD